MKNINIQEVIGSIENMHITYRLPIIMNRSFAVLPYVILGRKIIEEFSLEDICAAHALIIQLKTPMETYIIWQHFAYLSELIIYRRKVLRLYEAADINKIYSDGGIPTLSDMLNQLDILPTIDTSWVGLIDVKVNSSAKVSFSEYLSNLERTLNDSNEPIITGWQSLR